MTKILEKINYKQPKYMIPAIIYIPILFTGYFTIDMFATEVGEVENKELQTTEFLNPDLPNAKLHSGDNIGNKYENMVKSYGKIDDYTAVSNIDRDNPDDEKEEYESKYSEKDINSIETNPKTLHEVKTKERRTLPNTEQKLQQSAQRGNSIGSSVSQYQTPAYSYQAQSEREKKAIEDLNKAIAQARQNGEVTTYKGLSNSNYSSNSKPQPGGMNVKRQTSRNEDDDSDDTSSRTTVSKKKSNPNAVTSIDEKAEANEVVKKVKTTSDHFNTIAADEKEKKLIKAIIDENITAVDGSRVRLRLLDDIVINDIIIRKGCYLYATMSGFGSQRVKGKIKSVLVDDDLVKVDLSIYDTDGLEGLYVPSSAFREMTKDVASGSLNNTSSLMSGTNTSSNFSQFGYQVASNALQKSSNALSKSIKKNRAKLKYGTFVYLINSSNKK